jgi:hypothetical protein
LCSFVSSTFVIFNFVLFAISANGDPAGDGLVGFSGKGSMQKSFSIFVVRTGEVTHEEGI